MLPQTPRASAANYLLDEHSDQSYLDLPSSSTHAGEEEANHLSPFAQTLREQDENFYRTFPAARQAASPWLMVSGPPSTPFQGYVFQYAGQDMAKSWPSESSAASSSLWGHSGAQGLTAHTFSELAAMARPSSLSNSSLLPEQHVHYTYPRPQQPHSSSSPEASASSSEPPPTPAFTSYSESSYGSPTPQRLDTPSPPQEKSYFTSTFTAQPQPPYDSSKSASNPDSDYYRRKMDEEPIMDYLPSPTSPLSPSSPVEGAQPYSLSTPNVPSLGHTSDLIPINPASRSKSRRHTLPIPENENSRAFYYKLPRTGSSQSAAPPSYHRRPPPPPSKAEEKKQPTLACFFCRGRKIACGAPEPDSADRTCNQCSRRKLKCEYPKESRRGMRKKKASDDALDSSVPTPHPTLV